MQKQFKRLKPTITCRRFKNANSLCTRYKTHIKHSCKDSFIYNLSVPIPFKAPKMHSL